MRGLFDRVSTFGCVLIGAFLGAGAFVLAASFSEKPAAQAEIFVELKPADVIAVRFPYDWNEAKAAPAPAPVIAASYSGIAAQQALLSPRPSYQLASADGALPAFAYAPEPALAIGAEERAPVAAAMPPAAAPTAPPEAKTAALAAPAKAAVLRNARYVLNDGQIAGIKRRLALTAEQQRYWPAVERALRQMAWKKSTGDRKETKVIDMSTVDVDGLKSAAFPLVMSFNDEQKREMRSLAHLLGLDSVASRF